MENNFNSVNNFLINMKGKSLTILQSGFLNCEFNILELKYLVEYEILNILDNKTNNYLKINLNQIYKIENNKSKIILYSDNDTIITLSCEK